MAYRRQTLFFGFLVESFVVQAWWRTSVPVTVSAMNSKIKSQILLLCCWQKETLSRLNQLRGRQRITIFFSMQLHASVTSNVLTLLDYKLNRFASPSCCSSLMSIVSVSSVCKIAQISNCYTLKDIQCFSVQILQFYQVL